MKRLVVLFVAFVLVFNPIAKADEGMWFLAFIQKNYEQMKAKGFKLSIQDIYDINKSSLKDAIVALDHGSCSGEIISANGLLLTNHHCGYDEIQGHSSLQHDYLTDGFWAKTFAEELPNPGKTVSFLIKVEDVTDRINSLLNSGMSKEERQTTIMKIAKQIEKEASQGTNYEAEVKDFFNGNNFYLCVYEVFKDIRLVGAPPSSVGKYGGDTDNWMWYRHTGDFSIFRIYCAPDGSPAEYSPNNVPYKPKTFLKINISGVKEGDFTMIMGYPGSTQRYLTSWGVKSEMENVNKIRVKVREEKLRLMKQDMDANPSVRIQYASKYSSSSNYYKYSIGQNQGLTALKVYDKKKKIEKGLDSWIKSDKDNLVPKYGKVLETIEKAYTDKNKMDYAQNFWFEAIYQGPEIVLQGLKLRRMAYALQMGDTAQINASVRGAKEDAEKFFKDFNLPTEKKIMAALLKLYYNEVPKDYHPAFFEDVQSKFGGDFTKYADEIYGKSILTDKAKFDAFLANPTAETLNADAGYQMSISALEVYFKIMEEAGSANDNLESGMRLFTAALIEMQSKTDKNKLYYPDANSTMRLTYGNVGGYKAGKMNYQFFTDLDGYMKKEDPKNEEFIVAPKLKELWKAKDYGRYGKNGKLVTCFVSNNDITGGNSGSAVLNGKGELIGVAFDGNWEAMSGDIAFEPELQRTICVDIRFVLFVVEKYAGAKNLIDEMNIIE